MNGIFLDPVTARDQSYNVADVAADVVDIGRGKSILDVSADKRLLSQVDDLNMIRVVCLQIVFGSRGRSTQLISQ
jgi:hypothetical protein